MNNNYIVDENPPNQQQDEIDCSPLKSPYKAVGYEESFSPTKSRDNRVYIYENDEFNCDYNSNNHDNLYNEDLNPLNLQYINHEDVEQSPLKRKKDSKKPKKRKHGKK